LRAFEALARLGFSRMRPPGSPGPAGPLPPLAAPGAGPEAAGLSPSDVRNDQEWKAYASARALFRAWAPPPSSPWSGYAKPTLFAAADAGEVFPGAYGGLDGRQAAAARIRLPEATAVVLDLPGAWSVAMAAWLARAAGLQPVVLANNWPHPMGVVPMQSMLAALLHYVPWVTQDAQLRGDRALPVFVLDRDRLGRAPKPGEFDNRYFLLETDLPSPAALRRGGVQRILYVTPEAVPPPAEPHPRLPGDWGSVDDDTRLRSIVERLPGPEPATPEMDDLNRWLVEVRKVLGLGIATADVDEWRLKDAREFAPAPRKTVFTTVKDPAFAGFRRAAAGGFGRIVPEPGSGGYAGFG
jgi:hypothetical protein